MLSFEDDNQRSMTYSAALFRILALPVEDVRPKRSALCDARILKIVGEIICHSEPLHHALRR